MRALKITNAITRRDEKSIEKYLTEIARHDILTPEEEVKLFQQLRGGDQRALEKVVQHNLRFVVSVAKQYQHLGLHLGDLINEGNIGLIKAAQRFDETKGFKFISYAVWWIRQSIMQAINDKSGKIRVPQNVRSNIGKIIEKRSELMQVSEREPTVEELAEALDLSVASVEKTLNSNRRCASLDAPINEDEDMGLVGLLSDNSIPNPDHDLSVIESQKLEVRELLRRLSSRQSTVLAMYFGIGEDQPRSLEDIADTIGISRERVRQIKDRAIRRLRTLADDLEPTFSQN